MRGFADCRVVASGPLEARKRSGGLLPWLLSILFVAFGGASALADDAGAHEFVLREARGVARAAIIEFSPMRVRAPRPARTIALTVQSPRRASMTHARSMIARHKIAARGVVHAPAPRHVAAFAPPAAVRSQARVAAAPSLPPASKPEPAATAASRYTDSSLRKGDIVATEKGLRVFKGASHFPYLEADFVALPKAGRLGRELAALDTAIVGRQSGKRPRAEAASGRRPQARQRHAAQVETARLSYAPVENALQTPFAAVLNESETVQAQGFRTASRTPSPRIVGAGYIH